MTPELAPDYESRTVLSGYRVAFATFASLVAAAAPPFWPRRSTRGATCLRVLFRWRAVGVLFGALMSLAYAITALAVREPARPRERAAARTAQREGTCKALRAVAAAYVYDQCSPSLRP